MRRDTPFFPWAKPTATFIAIGSLLFVSGQSFGRTAACPCNPCRCSPCTCGGSSNNNKTKPSNDNKTKTSDSEKSTHHEGTKEKGHHREGDRRHGRHGGCGGGAVGASINVDLGGVGQRRAEGDPFAAPASNTTGHTAGNPSGTINVSDDKKPEEKKKKNKGPMQKPVWPKNIQDWLDLRQARSEADEKYQKASTSYLDALNKFQAKSPHLRELISKNNAAIDKANAAGATEADKQAARDTGKELDKQYSDLEKDFLNTADGKGENAAQKDAKKALEQAIKAEQDAAKDIDKATKDKVLKKMKKWYDSQPETQKE